MENNKGNDFKAGIILTIGVIILACLQGGRTMNRKRQMDDTLAIPQPSGLDKRRGLKIAGTPESGIKEDAPIIDKPEDELSWFGHRIWDLGVIDNMAQTKPPGFFVNWTNLLGFITVAGTIVGICIFLWNTAYQKGKDDFEKQIILERLKVAEDKADKAEKWQINNQPRKDEDLNKEQKKK